MALLERLALLIVVVQLWPTQASAFEATRDQTNFEIEKTLKRSSVVGAAWFLLTPDGGSRGSYYGQLNVESATAVDAKTRFRAGSFSKNLTALLALRLHTVKTIDLDAPLSPSTRKSLVGGSLSSEVTLASLLEHTAGLPGSTYRDYATGAADATTDDFLAAFGPFHLRRPPGTFFSYANPGYGIAAAAFEEASGRSFDDLMQSEIFEPLRIESGTYQTDTGQAGSVATGHDRYGKSQPTWQMLARPAGSLIITPADLAKVVKMYLRRGRLENGTVFVPEELIERMERGETSATARAGVQAASYGLGNFGFAIDGRIWRGHWGKTDGFLTNVGYLPEHGVGFVLMINTDSQAAMSKCRLLLASHLTEGLPQPDRPAVIDEPIDPSIAGYYINATHDMPMRDWLFRGLDQKRVRVDGQVLRVDSIGPHGASFEIYRPVVTGGFMPDNLPVATAAVGTIGDKQYWLEGEGFLRVSAVEAFVRRHLMLAATASSILLLLINSVRGVLRMWRREKQQPRNLLADFSVAATTVASVGFLMTFWLFVRYGLLGSSSDLRLIGRVTPVSVTLAVGSLATVIAGFAATPLVTARLMQKQRRAWWYGEAVLCIPLLVIAIVWAGSGWAPLITWQ